MSTSPAKVLVVGPVFGATLVRPNSQDIARLGKFNAKTLLGRVASLHKKNGPFDMALVIGDLFIAEGIDAQQDTLVQAFLDGSIDVPLPTYWLPGRRPIPQKLLVQAEKSGGEICPNFTFLGIQGGLVTTEGIRIAYLGGTDIHVTEDTLQHTDKDVQELLKQQRSDVDILITHDWPHGITQGSQQAYQLQLGSNIVADLAQQLRPRYHFAVSERQYYEREPYQTDATDRHVTRFIGLAAFGNQEKMQWAYAMNLVPISKASPQILAEQPSNTTPTPYQQDVKKRRHEENDTGSVIWEGSSKRHEHNKPPPSGYVCRICKTPGHWIDDCPEKTNRGVRANKTGTQGRDTSTCWFCLGNPQVAAHMIVSIGETFYMALPKGTLIDSKHATIPGGGHVILAPVQHCDSLYAVSADERQSLVDELKKYRDGLTAFYQKYQMVPVVFEVVRPRSNYHMFIQVVPLTQDQLNTLEDVVAAIAEEQEIKFTDALPTNPEANYFRLELPNGRLFVHEYLPRTRFNLQLGREIIARVLGVPDRADWRQCSTSEAQETEDTKALRDAFRAFDFTVQG